MFNSDLSFFVQSLATTSIEELVETTFFFIYNLGLQPSEVDRLTTYEYMRYLTRYKEVRKQEMEAQTKAKAEKAEKAKETK